MGWLIIIMGSLSVCVVFSLVCVVLFLVFLVMIWWIW